MRKLNRYNFIIQFEKLYEFVVGFLEENNQKRFSGVLMSSMYPESIKSESL
jgi:hypothetical protein